VLTVAEKEDAALKRDINKLLGEKKKKLCLMQLNQVSMGKSETKEGGREAGGII